MNLELDHVFILVEPGGQVADLVCAAGFAEGLGNTHPGQGTANRRFYFANGMLEFLWVRDATEARQGPGRDLCFPQRANDANASPFGVILHRTDNNATNLPFDGWTYQPDYFKPPQAFHVGSNSAALDEPLCIYVPFVEPGQSNCKSQDAAAKSISQVRIYTSADPKKGVLKAANSADRLSIVQGPEHLMEIELDDGAAGIAKDLRPRIPLIMRW